jgi:hypothetical protein
MESLTQARGFLAVAIEDVQYDLKELYFDTEQDRLQMLTQLQLLITAKGNLDALAGCSKDSQIFKSSIKF